MSKEYKAIKNYIHNELGLTKEDIINAIRSDIRRYVERCIYNTYGDDNNIKRWIELMVENELKNKDFNIIPRTVEKVLKDKMLNDIEIVVINKNLLDKARMEGMNQGIWLAVQELVCDGRWTQAAEELVSSCGLTEDECRKLQEESGSFDDEMLEFIDTVFGRKIDLDELDEDNLIIDISTMKAGDTYSFMNSQKEMVGIKAVKRSMLGCNGCYLSNSELLCKGCSKNERETNDDITVVRIDKMDDVYRNDRPLDSEIGVVHSFRINNKIIKAVACQTVIEDGICGKCCFVDTNICGNMRCFSAIRKDGKSVIFKKIEL